MFLYRGALSENSSVTFLLHKEDGRGGYQMSDTLFCLVLKGQMSICMRREMIVGKWSMTIFPSPKQITMTLE